MDPPGTPPPQLFAPPQETAARDLQAVQALQSLEAAVEAWRAGGLPPRRARRMARRILVDPALPRARHQALLLEGRIADWRRFLVSCVNQLAWLLLRISRPLQEWTMQASAMSRGIMTLGLARRLRTVLRRK